MDAIDPFADLTVAVSDLRMTYRTPSSEKAEARAGSFGQKIARTVLGRKPTVDVHALAGVSFVAGSGEQIGVVGQNGSGKSTLLRMIAGAERPTSGLVLAASTPVLIGVNAALVPDVSGERNIELGCLAMGMTPEQTAEAIPRVRELADLGKSIYLPMKTYSSGMGARLRFAIATATNPHILLIDEALATGDASFKERSSARMRELRDQAGTVFLVSHSPSTIEETCSRTIWMSKGHIVSDGPTGDVFERYKRWCYAIAKHDVDHANRILADAVANRTSARLYVQDGTAVGYQPRHAKPEL